MYITGESFCAAEAFDIVKRRTFIPLGVQICIPLPLQIRASKPAYEIGASAALPLSFAKKKGMCFREGLHMVQRTICPRHERPGGCSRYASFSLKAEW